MKVCFALPLRLILPCESRAMVTETVRGLEAGMVVVLVVTVEVDVVLGVEVVELGHELVVDLVAGADRS